MEPSKEPQTADPQTAVDLNDAPPPEIRLDGK